MNEFLTNHGWPLLLIVLQILAFLVPILVSVAYLIYAERKVMGAM